MNPSAFLELFIIVSVVLALLFMATFFLYKISQDSLANLGTTLKQFWMRGGISSDANKQLLSAWTVASNSASNQNMYFGEIFLETDFATWLNAQEGYKLHTASCSYDVRNCVYIAEIKNNGHTTLIQYSSSKRTTKDFKGRPTFKGVPVHTEQVAVITDVQVYTTVENDLHALAASLKAFALQYQHYEDRAQKTKLFRFTKQQGFNGPQYTLMPTYQAINIMGPTSLENSYSDVNIEFGGEQHQIPMPDAMKVAVESIKCGQNVYFTGVPGCGKTSAMQQLQAHLAHEGCRIIIVQPSVFEEMTQGEGLAVLFNQLNDEFDDSIPVLFIDEAETLLEQETVGFHSTKNTSILQILAGDLQKQLGLRTVLSFNAAPETLNPAMFRRGRAGLIFDLKPIKADRAFKFIEEVKSTVVDRVFDAAMFNELLNEENKLVNGVVYATSGEITLADIWACFIPKPKYHTIIQLLQKSKNPPKQIVEMQPANVVEDVAKEIEKSPEEKYIESLAAQPKPAVAAPVVHIKKKRHRRRK